MSKELEKALREAAFDTLISCPCGNEIEVDADKCPECNWKNPIKEAGLV